MEEAPRKMQQKAEIENKISEEEDERWQEYNKPSLANYLRNLKYKIVS